MGKATFTGELIIIPLPDNGARSLLGSVLSKLADSLDAQLFLKVPGDDLMEWPVGSIIGGTCRIEAARSCRAIVDVREGPSPPYWEFHVRDELLIACYCAEVVVRGLAVPGPIHPTDFPDYVRRFFQEDPRGWTSVIPTRWGRANIARVGALN
jgi:hypothetical protein